MNTDFNFTGMPDDSYKKFFDAVADNDPESLESLLDLNGLTETMAEYLADMFDSRATFKSVYEPWFGDEYKLFYPRLNRDARQLPKHKHTSALKTIAEVRYTELESHLESFNRYANALNLEAYLFNGADSQFNLPLIASNVKPLDISRFNMNRQAGGWTINKIAGAQAQAAIGFKYAMEILAAYGRESDWVFDLRHPIAFSDPSNKDLHKHNLPISSLRMVMGQHKIDFMNQLNKAHPTFKELANYRFMFHRWSMRHCTATFEHLAMDGPLFALTPWGMPGGIVINFQDASLPVTIDMRHTPGIDDIWQRIDPLAIGNVLDGEPVAPLGVGPSDSMLNLGWLAAAHASILSAGTNPGYGNKCMYWTHSNVNAAFIDFTMHVTPLILETARKELIQ